MSASMADGLRQSRSRRTGLGADALLWSEYLFIVAVVISEFILTIDPLHWNVNRITLLKHMPLAITIGAVILTASGRVLASGPSRPGSFARVMKIAWPFAALAAFITFGSLYSRMALGNVETFLNLGVYMGLVVLGAMMLLESSSPNALLRWYMGVLVIGAALMGFYIVLNYGIREVYHEQIFMVIPIAVWFVTALKNRLYAWLGAAAMLSLAFFSGKNTSYLVAMMTTLYIVWQQGFPRLRRMGPAARTFTYYVGAVLALAAIAVLAFIWIHRETYLPSGNVQYRSYTYARAWNMFLDSPLWGTAFADVSVKKFSLYSINIAGGVLPTHSDVMDMVANGGMVAMVLWGLGMFITGWRTSKWLRAGGPASRRWGHYGHTLIVVSAAGIVTYAFNPVLLEPGMAYMAWVAIGLLLGMSILAEDLDATAARQAHRDHDPATRKGESHG